MPTAQQFQAHSQSQALLVLPALRTLDFNENIFFAVYCFTKQIIGVSCGTGTIIHNKIEKAIMDLLESNVYSNEVKILQKHIEVLVDKIKQLELENAFLKSNAAPEVLQALNSGSAIHSHLDYDEEIEVAHFLGDSRQIRVNY